LSLKILFPNCLRPVCIEVTLWKRCTQKKATTKTTKTSTVLMWTYIYNTALRYYIETASTSKEFRSGSFVYRGCSSVRTLASHTKDLGFDPQSTCRCEKRQTLPGNRHAPPWRWHVVNYRWANCQSGNICYNLLGIKRHQKTMYRKRIKDKTKGRRRGVDISFITKTTQPASRVLS